jgi:hypothetical protein
MNLREEFEMSFGAYVGEEKDDRRAMLARMLETPTEQVVKMVEPHDLAAMMTCAVNVDARGAGSILIMDEFEAWQKRRDDAEDNYENPDTVELYADMVDAPFRCNKSVTGLDEFLTAAPAVEGGNKFLIQVFACLVWARKIPVIATNLWRPAKR